jgi:O-antigen/teichoic acid export membrane protein
MILNLKKLFSGDSRTVKARKNILASIVLKGIDSLVYLLLVPVTLGYLNPYEYGIWLTLSSILAWINSFDIGLGNGMRNKLAEAYAMQKKELCRSYVSTTFFMLCLLMGGIILVGSLVYHFIDWYQILNTTIEAVPHLDQIVYVAFAIFCLNFVFKIIGNVYLALQLPAVNNAIVTLGHLLSLIVIFILTKTTTGSLLFVAVAYTASPLLVYLLVYPVTFQILFPWLAPAISYFDKKYLKDLFSIGIQFFLLQLSGILLFAFANLLISHQFGPQEVTPYNIAFRYFSFVPMVMAIILSPMWSASTDAYAKGDLHWIQKTMSHIHKILLLAYGVIVLMVCAAQMVYRIWVGPEIEIPFTMSLFIGLYFAILISSLSYSNFLNGLGKLRVQTINTVTVAILFYPICTILGQSLGILGIVCGMCLLNLSSLVLNKIQFEKVISGKANGIWNK